MQLRRPRESAAFSAMLSSEEMDSAESAMLCSSWRFGVQGWNNLKGERALSAQDVSHRLVISYVRPPIWSRQETCQRPYCFANGAVSGWGVDGITTFQRGFPLKISYAGSTPLEAANLSVANIRPNVVPAAIRTAPAVLGMVQHLVLR